MTKEEAKEYIYDCLDHSEATEVIKALEQQPITWIVGKDNCQVAVRNMPVDMMQKICAIIGEEEQQPCKDLRDATEEERKSTKDYIDSISKPTGLQFDDVYEELDFVQPHKKISVNLQLCEDAISRESVIEWLKDKDIIKTKNQEENARRELGELPSVTPKTRWIPVSERLPEDGDLILFSTKTEVFEGRYFDDNTDHRWYSFRDDTFAWNNVVTAWMPLPQPYKAESEEGE